MNPKRVASPAQLMVQPVENLFSKVTVGTPRTNPKVTAVKSKPTRSSPRQAGRGIPNTFSLTPQFVSPYEAVQGTAPSRLQQRGNFSQTQLQPGNRGEPIGRIIDRIGFDNTKRVKQVGYGNDRAYRVPGSTRQFGLYDPMEYNIVNRSVEDTRKEIGWYDPIVMKPLGPKVKKMRPGVPDWKPGYSRSIMEPEYPTER